MNVLPAEDSTLPGALVGGVGCGVAAGFPALPATVTWTTRHTGPTGAGGWAALSLRYMTTVIYTGYAPQLTPTSSVGRTDSGLSVLVKKMM